MKPIGFIGLGAMGEPMAASLIKAGVPVMVWNRSADKMHPLVAAGATPARTAREVFLACPTVALMLANGAAMDEVLERGSRAFADLVAGRTLISMATTDPAYSVGLDWDVRQAGGTYVEAPVSGSRTPAELGRLVAMVAGDSEAVEAIRPVLAPMCSQVIFCGAPPSALLMKLAVNHFMIVMVTGLVEAFAFAEKRGLDLERLGQILDASPMASDVSRVKIAKLVRRDFSRQAAISNVLESTRLITEGAASTHAKAPLIGVCHKLHARAADDGLGEADMIAVWRALSEPTTA
jgi:3-hydroxyisobutyrate dehydrogenase